MSFGEQIFAALIGTVAGFLFSIALFYLKEKIAKGKNIELILDNAKFEIDFYKSVLEGILDSIRKAIEKITVDDKLAYANVDYSRLTAFFMAQFYQTGLMKDKLVIEDIDKLNSILIRFKAGSEAHINNTLQKYRDNQLDQQATLRNVTYERDIIEQAIIDLADLKTKINT